MKARQIGELEPLAPCTAGADETVMEATRRMVDRGICIVAVIEGTTVKGTLTVRELLRRVVLEGKDPRTVRLRDVMTPNPVTVGIAEDSHAVLEKMESAGSCFIPVTDRGRVVATSSARLLLRHEIAGKNEDIRDINERWDYLPPEKGLGG